jgi:hypothetical protein
VGELSCDPVSRAPPIWAVRFKQPHRCGQYEINYSFYGRCCGVGVYPPGVTTDSPSTLLARVVQALYKGGRVGANAILIRAGVSASVLPEKPVYTLLASAQPFYKCIVSSLDSALD